MATTARRGRPPKKQSQNAENVDQVKSSENKETEEKTVSLKESELKNLYKMIYDLQSKADTKEEKIEEPEEEIKINALQSLDSNIEFDDDVEIPLNSYIKVMSLLPYELNISTERHGKGRIFTYGSFGEVKRIIYQEVNQIIETYRHFLEKGYFIILDKRVIKKHGLHSTYEKILSKENIDLILLGFTEKKVRENDVLSMIKSASKAQQEVIADMILDKKLQGEEIDLNLLDKMARITGLDLNQRYENNKDFLDILNNK